MKKIAYNEEARKKIIEGSQKLANAVKITLGARGRNVAFERKYGDPIVTNDGVTIAKEVELEDMFENIGAKLMRQAANKTNDEAGDGTTTSTVLANALLQEGMKSITAGYNPILIKKGMDNALQDILKQLDGMSVKDMNKKTKSDIATVSCQDRELGDLIAGIMEDLGDDCVISMEESFDFGYSKEIIKGAQISSGWLNEFMINDYERRQCVLNNVPILIYDGKISQLTTSFVNVTNELKKDGINNLVIICQDTVGQAMRQFAMNNTSGGFHTLIVKAPFVGKRRREALKDLSILVGGNLILSDGEFTFDNFTLQNLGKVEKIISDERKTIIHGGDGDYDSVLDRINFLKTKLQEENGAFEKEDIIERLSRLSGGVAVIKVGASTDIELKEKMYKTEDAICSTKSAVQDGILPGGGSALALIEQPKLKRKTLLDEQVGEDIVYKAIQAPLIQIAENAGRDGRVILEKVKETKQGYDAYNDVICKDMIKSGIIDPTKVTKSALRNAVSVAGTFLTTECVIALVPNDDKDE